MPPSGRSTGGAARPARVAPARKWRRLNMAGLPGGESPPLIAQPYVSSMTDAGRDQNLIRAIHSAIATIITFSVSDTKPKGTLLLPPTPAPLISRLSIRSEEHTYELHSLMRTSYAVFCLKTQNHL